MDVATVLGAAVAFQVGGASGDTMLLGWTFGLPFSLPLAWLPAFGLNEQGTAVASWGVSHLALAASTVLSWSSFGLLIDTLRYRVRMRRPPAEPPTLQESPDQYLAAAHAEVEDLLRTPRTPVQEPRARNAFRRALSNEVLKLMGPRFGGSLRSSV